MREFYFDPITHIGGWYIPDDVCDGMVDFFHSEKDNWISGSKRLDEDENIFVDQSWKQSTELHLSISSVEIQSYLNNEVSIEECISKIQQVTRNYVKRQHTWWRSSNLNIFKKFDQFPDEIDLKSINLD